MYHLQHLKQAKGCAEQYRIKKYSNKETSTVEYHTSDIFLFTTCGKLRYCWSARAHEVFLFQWLAWKDNSANKLPIPNKTCFFYYVFFYISNRFGSTSNKFSERTDVVPFNNNENIAIALIFSLLLSLKNVLYTCLAL